MAQVDPIEWTFGVPWEGSIHPAYGVETAIDVIAFVEGMRWSLR